MKIKVNGQEIEVKEGELLLDAIAKTGIKVPTLCYIKDLFPSGACRMCVVEVDGWRNLVPSCSVQCNEGMNVKTHSPRVVTARKKIVELLLASHPDDCLYCDRNLECELQDLAQDLGVRHRSQGSSKNNHPIDLSSPAITRDPAKCILCGRCVRVCEEIEGVSAIDFIARGSKTMISPAFKEGMNMSNCVSCGQCVAVCPTGALVEKNNLKEVISALSDPNKYVVVQHAPAISVTIGEYFGFKAGSDVAGMLNAALRRVGFKRVFDTSFTADLTIMEEGSELVHRIKEQGTLPMMTSCCPGWVKYVEQSHPELLPNLSTCKSPQQMLGAVIKSYFAKKENIDPKKIFSVSVMPCTAKKFESSRAEMGQDGDPDIDVAITTNELAKLLKIFHIDFKALRPETADMPFGERSSAGKIFGVTGGVMEAAVRTATVLVTGQEPNECTELKEVRNLDGIREATAKMGELEVNVAVVSSLKNAQKLIDDMKSGKKKYHFIEVMTCPAGCISGGGQPRGLDREKVVARMKSLYKIDGEAPVRMSHRNTAVQELYKEFLGQPLGHKSHELLHTHYINRKQEKSK